MGSITRWGARLWREVRRRQWPFDEAACSSPQSGYDVSDWLDQFAGMVARPRAPMRRSPILAWPAAVPGVRWVSATVLGA
jgi:hypothetical protein